MNDKPEQFLDVLSIPDEKIIAKFLELREQKDAMKKEFDAKKRPINEAMQTLADVMLIKLNQRGAQNSKCKGLGTAYKSETLTVGCDDREKFLDYVREHAAWDLLTTNVAKDALKEVIKLTGRPPDGITVKPRIEVRFRRGND